jgi:hypothetical protein
LERWRFELGRSFVARARRRFVVLAKSEKGRVLIQVCERCGWS